MPHWGFCIRLCVVDLSFIVIFMEKPQSGMHWLIDYFSRFVKQWHTGKMEPRTLRGPGPLEDSGPYKDPGSYENPGPYEDSEFFDDPGETQELKN